jgi:hypothetical protein
MDGFNASEDWIRVLAIISPTCPECLRGVELIRRLFTRFDSKKLGGFILWVGMLKEDNEQIAKEKSEMIKDPRIMQFWDYDRLASRMFANTLRLVKGMAWDVYLLYSPRMRWENEESAPEPAFWMHQLTSDSSADPKLRLEPEKFMDETKFLLETEDPELSDKEVDQVLLEKKEFSAN